jgi:hypothetical protein
MKNAKHRLGFIYLTEITYNQFYKVSDNFSGINCALFVY